jgi:hypothetical protein
MNRSVAVWILIAAAGIAALVAGLALLRRSAPPAGTHAPLDAEAKAYLSKIVVTDARMSAAQNFIGDTVTYLDAKMTNQGSKTLRDVELRLEFVDTLDQVVLRDSAHPVTPRTLPLGPGKTRSFRVSFDHMPADWNQGPPRITPVYVSF